VPEYLSPESPAGFSGAFGGSDTILFEDIAGFAALVFGHFQLIHRACC
jgi:hypothetical protein